MHKIVRFPSIRLPSVRASMMLDFPSRSSNALRCRLRFTSSSDHELRIFAGLVSLARSMPFLRVKREGWTGRACGGGKMDVNRERNRRGGREGGLLTLRSFLPLYLSVFLIYGFNNAVTSAFSGYIVFLGGDMLLAGLQNSLFVLLAVGLRFALGPLADRRGARALLIGGAVSFLVPCLALPLCEDVGSAIALRSLQAFGLAAYHPNVAFYLTERSSGEESAYRISLTRFLSILSLMIVPAALFPLIGTAGYGSFFAALSFVAFSGCALVVMLPRGSSRSSGSRRFARGVVGIRSEFSAAVRQVFARELLPLIIMPAAFSAGYGTVLVFAPSVMQLSQGVSGGAVLSALSVGGMLGSAAATSFSRRLGVKGSLSCFAALFSLGLLGFSGAASSVAVLLVSACVGVGYFGATTLLVFALGLKLRASTSPSSPGSAFAAQQNFLDLGMVLGSAVSGAALSTPASFSWAFGVWGVTAAAGAIAFCVFYNDPFEERDE